MANDKAETRRALVRQLMKNAPWVLDEASWEFMRADYLRFVRQWEARQARLEEARATLAADPEKAARRNRAGAKNLKRTDPKKKAEVARANLILANAARLLKKQQG